MMQGGSRRKLKVYVIINEQGDLVSKWYWYPKHANDKCEEMNTYSDLQKLPDRYNVAEYDIVPSTLNKGKA